MRRYGIVVSVVLAWGALFWNALPARADLILVANEQAGTLSIIDRESGETRTLELGGDPHNLAVSRDGRLAAVTQPAAGLVSLVDPYAAKVLARVAVPGRPHAIALGPAGRWAYVGAERGRKIYRLDLRAQRLAGAFDLEAAPHNLVLAGGTAWITAQFQRVLWRVDLATGALLDRVETAASPHDLAVSPRDGALWVANWGSEDVYRLEGEPPRLEVVKITGRQPHHLVFTPDGNEVWITNHGSSDISVIDVRGRRELARVSVGEAPHHVAFSRDGRWAFVANSGSADVSVIDVAARTEVRRLPVGAHPHGMAVIPAAP